MIPLDLKRSVVLERFEFIIELYNTSQVDEWAHQTLRTITSPLFNELVIRFVHTADPWGPPCSVSGGWGAVDVSLNVLAERNPDFRVVFRGDFVGNCDVVRQHIESDYFPLASSKGFVTYEQVPNVEDRFRKLGIPLLP